MCSLYSVNDESGRSVTRLIAVGNGRSTIRSPCPMAASALLEGRRRHLMKLPKACNANCTTGHERGAAHPREYLEPDRTITSAS